MSSTTPAPAESAPKSHVFFDYLVEQGFRPKFAAEDNISFKREGGNYSILLNLGDPGYLRLIFPKFWSSKDAEERGRMLEAANLVNTTVKVAKVHILESNAYISIEVFLPEPSAITKIFDRCLSAVDLALSRFREEMGKNAPRA